MQKSQTHPLPAPLCETTRRGGDLGAREPARNRTLTAHTFRRDLGTVGAVALDSKGDVAYATSTGGIVNKMVGRVGDTPCVGRPVPSRPSLGPLSLCPAPLSSSSSLWGEGRRGCWADVGRERERAGALGGLRSWVCGH